MAISRIFKFKSYKLQLPAGERTKIKVRRDLLSPYGKEGADKLHLVGTTFYINFPKGGKIDIGSSRDCDVRIKDPAIGEKHLRIEHKEDGFQITELDLKNREILFADTETGKTKLLAATDLNERLLQATTFISIFLSGSKKGKERRALVIKLEIGKEKIKNLIASLQKPPVKPI